MAAVLEAVLAEVPVAQVNVHLHDTHGRALDNIIACLALGVRSFDASTGGVGGCPFAPGATGNVATEDLVWLFQGLGIKTGLNLDALVETGSWISEQIGRRYSSRVGAALAARRATAEAQT